MKGLTLTPKEETRVQVLNGVLEGRWSVGEAAAVFGVSERHTWRLLAAYQREGIAALAHGNRGRVLLNATLRETRQRVIALVQERYGNMNYTHLAELLGEQEGIMLSRSTVRRLLVGAGLPSSHATAVRPSIGPGARACPKRACYSRWMAAIPTCRR